MHRSVFHAPDLAIRPYIAKIEVWGDLGDFAVFFIYLYINSRSTTEWPVCESGCKVRRRSRNHGAGAEVDGQDGSACSTEHLQRSRSSTQGSTQGSTQDSTQGPQGIYIGKQCQREILGFSKNIKKSKNEKLEICIGAFSMRRIWPYGHI